jgi:hypothetical protein
LRRDAATVSYGIFPCLNLRDRVFLAQAPRALSRSMRPHCGKWNGADFAPQSAIRRKEVAMNCISPECLLAVAAHRAA